MSTVEPIEKRSSFDFIRYANCWEDSNILVKALDTGPGKSFMSIASAGDNSLALLTLDPERVVAVDLSYAQLACTELRKLAIEFFDYETTLVFLGFKPDSESSVNRLILYKQLKDHLSHSSREFWDANQKIISLGIIYHGKFERYFQLFRNKILPLIHSKKTIQTLLKEKNIEDRFLFYATIWNNIRWRYMFRFFFSRFVMGLAGRDPEFFRFVEGSVGQRILERAKHALTNLPTHNNPYLQFILTGSFSPLLPFYMQPSNFSQIKANIKRLEIFHGNIGEYLKNCTHRFDGFNCSDIFEYMDTSLFTHVSHEIIEHAVPKARIVYWNMLVYRRISSLHVKQTRLIEPLSRELFAQDKAFFYQAFLVDEVLT